MQNCNFCGAVKKWLAQPFKENGSALDWFLFMGLIFIAAFFWSRILVRVAP